MKEVIREYMKRILEEAEKEYYKSKAGGKMENKNKCLFCNDSINQDMNGNDMECPVCNKHVLSKAGGKDGRKKIN